jgi:sensor domain CHASE-containing protein
MLFALLLLMMMTMICWYCIALHDMFCRQQKDELLKASTEELVQQRTAAEREMEDLKSLLGECCAVLMLFITCIA